MWLQLIALKYIGFLLLFGLGSVGCDGIVGSTRKFDRCGVCDGDNSTCRVVSGIFTRPQLPVGYNMVAHIPKGACNLNITQIRKSPNYLALRRLDGTYILNGNWAISWPGTYEGAGTRFRYTRQDAKSLESIESPGPLFEPVDLLVLSQQPNPGIKYEYMIATSDTSIPTTQNSERQTYQFHRQEPFASQRAAKLLPLTGTESGTSLNFSSSPKTSTNNNDIAYLTKVSTNQPSPEYIHSNRRRHSHHHYNHKQQQPVEKKFYWKVTGYTLCSEICGGGTQKSIVRCVKESNGATVADRRCEPDEKPQVQTGIRCNLKPCPAEWTLGSWTACSVLCGEGFQTRTVHCQQRISPTLTMRVADGACLNPQPESRKNCKIKACYSWDTTAWSQCSTSCGNGIRSRTIRCVNAREELVDDAECNNTEKPSKVSTCNMGPCEGVGWFASEWSSECTEHCGSGVQNRHVTCSALGVNNEIKIDEKSSSSRRTNRKFLETETNIIDESDENAVDHIEDYTDESLCDQTQKPASLRECYSDRRCGEPVWVTGPWSECSMSCGSGLKSRKVLCLQFARGKFKIGEESQCSRTPKPETQEVCYNPGALCPPRWFTSEWDDCSTRCGGGTQRRTVSCREAEGNITSSSCSDLTRPIDKRSCNEHKCANEVSSSSGDGVQFPRLRVEGAETYNPPNLTTTTTTSTTSSPRSLSHNDSLESSGNLMEPNEEPDDTECKDDYRNCALVVQARLCRYKYYRSVCCTSCSEN